MFEDIKPINCEQDIIRDIIIIWSLAAAEQYKEKHTRRGNSSAPTWNLIVWQFISPRNSHLKVVFVVMQPWEVTTRVS
jgi:hypothetical protein